ncbi:CLUMA_CG007714, isoform A [Clunio marinus]|uniref:CLUMA_CG007714, isoform A n=1 Tax=Clunio marinus TaxID=568069 RepID=A0A1J1I5J5_9DIPT|nr:CLUMA_CG007714, isoform A [Clunio marinus]
MNESRKWGEKVINYVMRQANEIYYGSQAQNLVGRFFNAQRFASCLLLRMLLLFCFMSLECYSFTNDKKASKHFVNLSFSMTADRHFESTPCQTANPKMIYRICNDIKDGKGDKREIKQSHLIQQLFGVAIRLQKPQNLVNSLIDSPFSPCHSCLSSCHDKTTALRRPTLHWKFSYSFAVAEYLFFTAASTHEVFFFPHITAHKYFLKRRKNAEQKSSKNVKSKTRS